MSFVQFELSREEGDQLVAAVAASLITQSIIAQ